MATPTTRTAAPAKSATKMAAGAKTNVPNLQVDDLMSAYVPARLPEGTVTGVWGRAIIRPAGGQPRPLVVGDEVHKGDMILTSQNGIVQIKHEGDRLARIPEGESLENVLVALNAGDAPPAAGFSGDGSLQPGLRLDRLYEVVSPQQYSYDAAQAGSGIALRAAVDNSTPTVTSVEPGNPGRGDDAVLEGTGTPNQLVFTVTLSHASTGTVAFPISIGSGNSPPYGSAASNDYAAPTFSNGVVMNANGTLTVPAGVSKFTITIPTVPDGIVEPDEVLPVTVGGLTGTGVILNDDHAPAAGDFATNASKNSDWSLTPTAILDKDHGNVSDPDGDKVTFVGVQNATHGSVEIVNGAVVFHPEANYVGPASFQYLVQDAYGNTTAATVTLNLTNDPPTAHRDLGSATEMDHPTDPILAKTAANGVILATDPASAPDGPDSDPNHDSLTVATVATAGGTAGVVGQLLEGTYGHLKLNSDGSYTYQADKSDSLVKGAVVQDVFNYTVVDSSGATSNPTTLTITVTGVDSAPITVGSLADQSSNDGAIVSFSTAAAFRDPDTNTGTGTGLKADVLTYSASNLPTGLSIDAATGVISGTLASDASIHGTASSAPGTYAIVVTATDPYGLSTTQTLKLVVANLPPVAAADSNDVTEKATVTTTGTTGVLANDHDTAPDNDPLTVTGVRTSTGTEGTVGSSLAGRYGHLTLNKDGSYSYIADLADSLAQGARATDTFSYTASDSQGGAATAQLAITVTGINDAPKPDPNGKAFSTNEDTQAKGNLLANATDVDTPHADLRVLSFSVAGLSGSFAADNTPVTTSAGTFQVDASGNYVFTPSPDYNNTAATAPVVTYIITDGMAQATGSLTLRVIPVPDAVTDGSQTWEGRAVAIDVLKNDNFSDATRHIVALNGTPVTAGAGAKVPVIDSGTQVGTVSLNGDGTVTFEPVVGYTNTLGTEARFTYTVSAGGSTESASVYVKVDPALPLTELTPLRAWTFDQTSGTSVVTVKDEGDAAQTGTLQGSATLVTGHIGDALQLDGKSGYMKFAVNANGSHEASASLLENAATSAASLSFWVKVAAGQAGGGAVIGSNSATTTDTGYNMQWGLLNNAGQIGVARGTGAGNQVFSDSAVNDGNWHHVVISCGPGSSGLQTVAIWIDGSLETTSSVKVDSQHLSFSGFGIDNAVGASNGSDHYFTGTLDDIRVQSGLLDEESVAAIYTAEKTWASNTDTSHMVIDNDHGSIAFAIAGSPSSLQFSGAPDGAVLTDNQGHSVVFSGGSASLASTAGWDVNHLQISGLGSNSSAQISVYATLSDAAQSAAKVTIDVVAGHAATHADESWTSGIGSDVFRWTLADAGTTTTPGHDVIKGFNGSSSVASGGDVLDLRDLLVGEKAGTIGNFLQIDLPSSSGGSTTIHVSSTGGFSGGVTAGKEDQTIVLEGNNLATSLGLVATATNQQVIAEMLKQGKLMIDN